MIERKKKLRFIQLILLLCGTLIIYLTYYNNENNSDNKIGINKESKVLIDTKNETQKDIFFNIEYSGLDLNGNRYILKSKKAYPDKEKSNILYMKEVNAVFYFKDNTNLYVSSDEGIYDNKLKDMEFEKNVKANYLDTDLYAEKANYSNSKSYIDIYDNVRIYDIQGNLIADKLLFDITNQNLNITSFNDGKINANVKLNEKRF
jgi:LPS export ABC transporter protein LptC